MDWCIFIWRGPVNSSDMLDFANMYIPHKITIQEQLFLELFIVLPLCYPGKVWINYQRGATVPLFNWVSLYTVEGYNPALQLLHVNETKSTSSDQQLHNFVSKTGFYVRIRKTTDRRLPRLTKHLLPAYPHENYLNSRGLPYSANSYPILLTMRKPYALRGRRILLTTQTRWRQLSHHSTEMSKAFPSLMKILTKAYSTFRMAKKMSPKIQHTLITCYNVNTLSLHEAHYL